MSRGGRGRGQTTTKLYVGNLPESCRRSDLLQSFEKFGKVVECDIVKNYAFVHYDDEEEAKAATAALDDTVFHGAKIKVEMSHSRVRQKPGMGSKNECYRCGSSGHWSKDCPKGVSTSRSRSDRGGSDREGYRSSGSKPPPPPLADPYRDPYRDLYLDYYRDRFPPPPPLDRYRPYPHPYERRLAERRLSSELRDPYYRDRDPYARPPPDYYSRRSPVRDPYYYYERRYAPLPPPPDRQSPKPAKDDSAYASHTY